MINAIILINAEKGAIQPLAERLAEEPGISEVYSTCGRVDLVAVARVADFDALSQLVTGRLNEIEGIRDTETLSALKVHSRHDLETMFSVGL